MLSRMLGFCLASYLCNADQSSSKSLVASLHTSPHLPWKELRSTVVSCPACLFNRQATSCRPLWGHLLNRLGLYFRRVRHLTILSSSFDVSLSYMLLSFIAISGDPHRS
ncbi:hypothetical protein BD410DRAFT_585944 [Rickenella mellea]|uniref:Secreted protein n=1 Tax=Rickenella mellea TaxID=50990 RepID=A0A4Y7PPG8_9AGAM|nr:hypothetical protein BD410DRAFT_585944 [Rickenella mellea]